MVNLKEVISKYSSISILSGAGISTLSGIPCYMGDSGIYNDDYKGYPIGGILTSSFYHNHNEVFVDYYFNLLFKLMQDKKPNFLHMFAMGLDKAGKLNLCITQNIDTLYEQTGVDVSKLCKIHGTYDEFVCTKCGLKSKRYHCCDSVMKPKVVLYDENFNGYDFQRYQSAIKNSDLLIVMGTRLDIIAHKQSVIGCKGDVMLINNEHIDLVGYGVSREWDYELIVDFNELDENQFIME